MTEVWPERVLPKPLGIVLHGLFVSYCMRLGGLFVSGMGAGMPSWLEISCGVACALRRRLLNGDAGRIKQ
jgi:hypothetical protein